MLGSGAVKPKDTAEERAKNVFARFVYDDNNNDVIMAMILGWMRTMMAH